MIAVCGHMLHSRNSDAPVKMHRGILSTPLKDAGIVIRHLQGYMISILQGPEMGLREWKRCVHGHKNKLTLSKA